MGLKRNTIPGLMAGWDDPGTTALSIYTPSQQIKGQQKGLRILSLRHIRPPSLTGTTQMLLTHLGWHRGPGCHHG